MQATAKDLRIKSKEILSAVERGEEVIITYRGVPKARIVPIKKNSSAHKKKTHRNSLFGIWKDNKEVCDVDSFINAVREKRKL
ncbi:MAG: prevent-host-death protein [Candidatus Schekmanbacteria bacterium RBG_13_48_7]|uniref:Antitoxin n=1 Tax=Candidatus Schekmanbacteria bacterium RBG_13_48_7 TaxID=1817878 RepID=A0A1F7S4T7_9BACT|nr:MAG: prevent-host-death protein [Candidatus Schekmanbacteria bacterium RBG_13_48_7]